MGSLFSSKKKEQPKQQNRITEQDKAVLVRFYYVIIKYKAFPPLVLTSLYLLC